MTNDDGGYSEEKVRIRNDYIKVRNALHEALEVLDRIPYLMIHYEHLRGVLRDSVDIKPYRYEEGVLLDGVTDSKGESDVQASEVAEAPEVPRHAIDADEPPGGVEGEPKQE